MPTLTVFSAPKPFIHPHVRLIQTNAIRSWKALGPEVEVILVGEETGLAEAAAELGTRHLPEVRRNPSGTPLVSSIFDLARRNSQSPLLAYVNADILLLPGFLETACRVLESKKEFLVVGQRWDLAVSEPLDFAPGWGERLRRRAQTDGKLHTPTGSDYFLFPRDVFATLPEFAIGRAGWDNWMIYQARRQGWAVIDASREIFIVHQNHDYAHLPGGRPHYHLPESDVNVRLGGGRRRLFNLIDADNRMEGSQVLPARHSWKKLWREVEILPLVRWGWDGLSWALFVLFHPGKAFGMARGWAQYKFEKKLTTESTESTEKTRKEKRES